MAAWRTALLGIGLGLAGGCAPPDPAANSQKVPVSAEAPGAIAVGEGNIAARPEALCRISYGDESKAKTGLKLQFRVGDISLYSEPGGLLCSEPAGFKGDCQIVRGKTIVAAQAGKPDARIEALTAAPYLVYGPDGVRCSPPPPPVPR
jgi:hypothetical protein